MQCDIVENMEFEEGEGVVRELRLRKTEQEVKQLLFGEIDGLRFRGRSNMQWIDCIIEDLKTFNISNNPKEEWTKIRDLALDRVKWKSLIKEKE